MFLRPFSDVWGECFALKPKPFQERLAKRKEEEASGLSAIWLFFFETQRNLKGNPPFPGSPNLRHPYLSCACGLKPAAQLHG